MVNVHLLGTGAALPLADRNSAGVLIRVNEAAYLFDVGAGVAASLLDPAMRDDYGIPAAAQPRPPVDPYALRGVFISHAHIDHIGDLPQLLSALRLFAKRDPSFRFPNDNTLVIFLPAEVIEPLQQWLSATGIQQKLSYTLRFEPIRPGECYRDPHARIEAIPSDHCQPNAQGLPASAYSFRLRAANKTIVYTGDLTLANLKNLLPDVDLLLTECAHLQVDDIVMTLKKQLPGKVVLLHLSPTLYGKAEPLQAELRDKLGPNVWVAQDGLRVEV